MLLNGRYSYSSQHKRSSLTPQSEGQAKAATRTNGASIDVWALLQLGAATAVIVAAIVVLTSFAG